MAFSVGETLQDGKYYLHALLDQQVWGMTFLATHESVDQQVVIKTFQAASEGPSPLQIASYIDYAKKLRRFHHPHLSRVIGIFEERDQACMVSEFIQGIPLSQLITEQPLNENTALTYIRQIAQGLHALHRHGLLHLNLSPSRIVKRQGDGKTILLGLNSRFASQEAEREHNPYLSFEQHQTPAVPNLASEIYGISAVLYHLVTGQAPVLACDRTQTPLVPPRQIRPELSQSIEDAIISGMALAPSDRPQRIKDWVKRLPSPQKVDTNTKLQIPSAWQVKLPAFHEAGVTTALSTTITPRPSEKTTLQQPALVPDQNPLIDGHDDHNLASDAPTSQAKTALQSSSSSEPDVTPTIPASPSSIEVSESPHEKLSERPSGKTFMPANRRRPSPQTHRFPKWTLFWCALIAAFGGLGAGLWLRINLTRQFAMPAKPIEASPVDQLRTLKTKQEEFLPTQNSIIPEEKSDTAEIYEFESSDENALEYGRNPEADGREGLANEPWRESESWSQGPENSTLERLDTQPYLENQPSNQPYEADAYSDTNPVVSDPLPDPEFEQSRQPVEEPIDIDSSDSFVNDPSIDTTVDDSYRSDGNVYVPDSGTF